MEAEAERKREREGGRGREQGRSLETRGGRGERVTQEGLRGGRGEGQRSTEIGA